MLSSSVYDDLDSTLKSGINRAKMTTIGHKDHLFTQPVNPRKLDEIIPLLGMEKGKRVLDIGCAKAELLTRIVEQTGASAVGVDTNPFFLADARARVEARLPEGDVTLLERYLADYRDQPGSYDVAMCIGQTHAFGGYRHSLTTLMDLVKPSGVILVGEAFWRKAPDPTYLATLGANLNDYGSHYDNVNVGVEEGLIPIYTAVSSEDDWDHYHGLYWRAIERYGLANTYEADTRDMVGQARLWRDAYLRWGRDTLGFGLYLFTK